MKQFIGVCTALAIVLGGFTSAHALVAKKAVKPAGGAKITPAPAKVDLSKVKPVETPKVDLSKIKPVEKPKVDLSKVKPVETIKPDLTKVKPVEKPKVDLSKVKPVETIKPDLTKIKPVETPKLDLSKTKPLDPIKIKPIDVAKIKPVGDGKKIDKIDPAKVKLGKEKLILANSPYLKGDYHLKCGKLNKFGLYCYHGFDHCHWHHCIWDPCCGGYIYYCPSACCYYYWVEVETCYCPCYWYCPKEYVCESYLCNPYFIVYQYQPCICGSFGLFIKW